MAINPESLGAKAVLLDIEGTTTPVAFVFDVLFPYARNHLKDYLAQNFKTPDMQSMLQTLRKEHETDVVKWAEPPHWDNTSESAEMRTVTLYLLWLMDKDRKSPALKRLQGKIWEGGYRSKALQGEVYPDVPPALKRWTERGLQVYIYSSGSVLAQKLLFGNLKDGDLIRYFRGFFDTRMGPKNAPESYRKIAKETRHAPKEILFISDQEKELKAARQSGLHTLLCIRQTQPFENPDTEQTSTTIKTFDEID